MSFGKSKSTPAPVQQQATTVAPAPTIFLPGVEKARLDLAERMRRARSRLNSRFSLMSRQRPYDFPPNRSGTSLINLSGTGGAGNIDTSHGTRIDRRATSDYGNNGAPYTGLGNTGRAPRVLA